MGTRLANAQVKNDVGENETDESDALIEASRLMCIFMFK